MNNEPMYNAFIKNREQAGNQSSKFNSKRKNDRVKPDDLPDFVFDVDDPSESDASSFAQGPVVGVDRTLGNYSDLFRHEAEDDTLDDCDDALTSEPFEFEDGCVSLPHPDVFNSYPPEVQRKIMEWTDRDIRARRDDESRRQDAILRANIARDKTRMAVPVVIIIMSILCAAITGLYTKNALFVIAFLVVALVVIIALFVSRYEQSRRGHSYSQYPKM